MKRNQRIRCIRRYLAFLLMINCILMFRKINVQAQSTPVSVTLPLEQIFLSDGLPVSTSATTFQYEMLPETPTNPMPVGASDGVYVVTMTGAETMSTDPIVYTHTGVFSYTFKASTQNDTTGYVADNEEYKAHVYVGRNPNDTLEATVVAMNRANVKVAMLGFSYEIKDTGLGSGGLGSGESGLGGIGSGGLGDSGTGGLGMGSGGFGTGTSGSHGTSGLGNNVKGSSVNTGDYAETRILWATIITMCIVIIYLFYKKQLDFYEQP